MAEIRVLDNQTIDQIAAGEVIERPMSVVKELVENALDAGADRITVELKNGGLDLIRVTDNGAGIPREQVPVAFARHATSKIRDAGDLFALYTLGFRGEALSSIASVARVELITRTEEALCGFRYCIEGGTVLAAEDIAAPQGTSFLVRDLFFNTPVRRKFLKSASAETAYVATLMEQLTLSRPGVSMQLLADGREKLRVGGSYSLKDTLYALLGRETARLMRPLDYEDRGIRVFGYVGLPSLCRGNRSLELCFVNGRYIKSPLLLKAIEQAYHGLIMQHKFPVAVLHLQMEPSALDVNVHPTKLEVRFREEKAVFDVCYRGIREALFSGELIPEVTENAPAAADKPAVPAAEIKTAVPVDPEKAAQAAGKADGEARLPEAEDARPAAQAAAASAEEEKAALPAGKVSDGARLPETGDAGPAVSALREETGTAAAPAGQEEKPSQKQEGLLPAKNHWETGVDYRLDQDRQLLERMLLQEADRRDTGKTPEPAGRLRQEEQAAEQLSLIPEEKILEGAKTTPLRLIGQVFDTYWLLEYGEWFLLADQHAVHEKVLYERNMQRLALGEATSQLLEPPLMLTLSAAESHALEQYRPGLEKLGFEIADFGGRDIGLTAVPDNLLGLGSEALFRELLEDLAGGSRSGELLEAKVAMMSCKAAVKGGEPLSFPEAEALFKKLLTLENPYCCPHGRPTLIRMSRTELEKKFKRIV